MTRKKKPRISGWLRLIPFLFVCIIAYVFGTLRNESGNQPTDANLTLTTALTITPHTVVTDTGTYTVPGRAFADGRDLLSSIPLTINEILVWDTVERNEDVCVLEHGEEVRLDSVQFVESEDRYYFEIDAPFCFGWIPSTFLSTEKQPSVGQIVP